MPAWQNKKGWMSPSHLDDGEGLDGTFVIAFKITDDGADPWTARMNRFKARNPEALSGATAACGFALPALLDDLGLSRRETLLVPAISSRDQTASAGSFTSLLASACAREAQAGFDREVVSKQIHQPLHGIYDAAGRTAQLDQAAYAAKSVPGIRHFIIIDDLVTRGGTMSRMARALKAANPGTSVHGVALGKTERRAYWGTLTNDHVHAKWEELWLEGERRYRER